MMNNMPISNDILQYHNAWLNLPIEYVIANWNKKLYHILPYKYFLDILKNHSLYFVNIFQSWWDEPYELFYYRPNYFSQINGKSVHIDVKSLAMSFYAQCWSENRDSDAMWRIYSGKNYDGVRIATTLGEIIKLLYPITNINQFPNIGFMRYEWKKDIKQWLANHSSITFLNWREAAVESLFMKRKNFSHEKEFRIIFSVPTMQDNGRPSVVQNHLSIPIDINTFIKEITFSPFIDSNKYGKHYRNITRYLNGNIPVNQSYLYTDDISNKTITLL